MALTAEETQREKERESKRNEGKSGREEKVQRENIHVATHTLRERS